MTGRATSTADELDNAIGDGRRLRYRYVHDAWPEAAPRTFIATVPPHVVIAVLNKDLEMLSEVLDEVRGELRRYQEACEALTAAARAVLDTAPATLFDAGESG